MASWRRAPLLGVVVSGAAIAIGAVTAIHHHRYGVLLFSPGSIPGRIQVCGRSFHRSERHDVIDRRAADTRYPAAQGFERVGELQPFLHRSMEILGHPQTPECGLVLFVGTDDDHLSEFVLMGGP